MVVQFNAELKGHMKRKYKNDFSLEFLDIIQTHVSLKDAFRFYEPFHESPAKSSIKQTNQTISLYF